PPRLPPSPTTTSSAIDHAVLEHADAGDLDLDDVGGIQVADARGRARRDDVAGLERHVHARERDERRHVEDQIARRRVLANLTVDARDHAKLRRIQPTDDAGPDRAERVEALRARPLTVALLEVADGDVVDARETHDGAECIFSRHPPTARTDDDSEL